MTPIFRWSGEYVGFLSGGWFFDANGRYLGWSDDGVHVWKSDGVSLGQIVDRNYILCSRRMAPPVRRTPPVPPLPPTPPQRPGSRTARVPRPGWVDALREIGRMPARHELVGKWRVNDALIHFREDGCFVWSVPSQPAQTGEWEYRGNLMTTPDVSAGETPYNIVYRVIEFSGDRMTIRRLTEGEHNLPLTLQRLAPTDTH